MNVISRFAYCKKLMKGGCVLTQKVVGDNRLGQANALQRFLEKQGYGDTVMLCYHYMI